jgi:sec-independent protein translocase protein TatB|nr:Sec-independent protein translocase protein TatB [uncultured bacterium]
MFDIAWSELFVIIIVALVVVGPKDLPKLMRTVGQWAAKARTMADQFKRSFDDMARQAELDQLRSEVSKLKADTMRPMTDADYEALGIPVGSLPAAPAIEDVGAAPPVFDKPPGHVEAAPSTLPANAAAAPEKTPDPV